MKKQLIATLVGAAILFVWQFLSWALLPVHKSEFGHTPNQDKIMEFLNQNLSEEGTYMLPMSPPGSSPEQEAALMESSAGKPWASISYHRSFSMAMGMNMFRGFAADLLAAWLLVWLLMQFQTVTLRSAVQASVAVCVFGYLTISYLNSVWFESNSMGFLVDALASGGLLGLWLGWWLPRR